MTTSKMCLQQRLTTVCGLVWMVVGAMLQGGCQSNPAPPPSASQLELELQGLGLEPHPYRGVWVDRGAVLNKESRETAYAPSYAFKDPTRLLSASDGSPVTGVFIDERKADASASAPFLNYLGLTADASLNYDWKIESNVVQLRKRNIRVDQFARAELTDEFAASLDETRGFIAIEAVGNSEKLRLTFLNKYGAHAAVSDATRKAIDMRAEATKETSGTREYENFTFASRPIFRAGGPGSRFTRQMAQEYADGLRDLGIESARVIENTVIADQLSWKQVNAIWGFKMAYTESLRSTKGVFVLVHTVTPNATLCETIRADFEVKNIGSGAATNLVVSGNLPAGLTAVDGSITYSFQGGTLAQGKSKRFSLGLKALKAGSYSIPSTVTADDGLVANSETQVVNVTQPSLRIVAQCPQGGVVGRIGKPLTFKFTVTNDGDAPANTTVSATTPTNATFASADNNGFGGTGGTTWNLGTLAPGASKTVSMSVQAVGTGSISTTATATAPCATAVSAPCSVSLAGLPDVGVLVSDADGVVYVGTPHEYTCQVMNQGMVPLTNVKLTVDLPRELVFVGSSQANKIENGKLTFVVGTLAVGQSSTWKFRAKATGPGEMLISVIVSSAELRVPVRDDELTNFVSP